MIEIKGLKKLFRSNDSSLEVLKGIDLDIPSGSIYGVIGLSGAGKSTLVRCINGLEVPDEGSVIVDGEEVSSLRGVKLQRIKQSMGMIFQQFNLLMQCNVEKNVRFPLDITKVPCDVAKSRVDKLLRIVGLEDKKRAYPAQLSGGQKQRVAIARALATNPKILLCDEATSALDPETTRSILNLLVEINCDFNITIVIITHEMQVAQEICTHLAVMDKGEIAECGKVEEIFKNPKTDAARRLILHNQRATDQSFKKGCFRITFDTESTYEPMIADLVLECQTRVNILFADVESVDGRTYGHMVIELPGNEEAKRKALAYLRRKCLTVEEGDRDV